MVFSPKKRDVAGGKEEHRTPKMAHSSSDGKRLLIFKMESHRGKDFDGETISNGVIVVFDPTKQNACDVQIFLHGPNLMNDCQSSMFIFSLGRHSPMEPVGYLWDNGLGIVYDKGIVGWHAPHGLKEFSL